MALPLAASEVRQLIAYTRLIERWNSTYNLTAIRDPREMVTHHVLDCLAAAAALIRHCGPGHGERIVDVGSGAGLPGIVLAMASPHREVTCVDSVGKKAAFITQAIGALRLKNVRAVHARIQDLPERFDIATSRPFASLKDFVSATDGVLRPAGTWMAMKGKAQAGEFGLEPGLTFHVEPLVVPHLREERCIVWMRRSNEASAYS